MEIAPPSGRLVAAGLLGKSQLLLSLLQETGRIIRGTGHGGANPDTDADVT